MVRIGIDVGGTNIKAGVVNDAYEVIGIAKRKTEPNREVSLILDDIANTAFDALKDAGQVIEDVTSVGVGFPGTCNDDTGLVEYANNLGLTNVPVCKELEKRLNVSVYMENDANAAVYGEYLAGALQGSKNCICITLGTGIGGGILLDGKIFSGINFAGAELGHMVIEDSGTLCNCGRKGCWEMYASVTALKETTKEVMLAHPESQMWSICTDVNKVSGKTAFEAMRQGDPIAKEIVDHYVHYIGVGLINIINIFQPEYICIGGAISKEGDVLLEPLKKMIQEERYSRYSHKQSIICTAKLGNAAGIVGAAFLDRLY